MVSKIKVIVSSASLRTNPLIIISLWAVQPILKFDRGSFLRKVGLLRFLPAGQSTLEGFLVGSLFG